MLVARLLVSREDEMPDRHRLLPDLECQCLSVSNSPSNFLGTNELGEHVQQCDCTRCMHPYYLSIAFSVSCRMTKLVVPQTRPTGSFPTKQRQSPMSPSAFAVSVENAAPRQVYSTMTIKHIAIKITNHPSSTAMYPVSRFDFSSFKKSFPKSPDGALHLLDHGRYNKNVSWLKLWLLVLPGEIRRCWRLFRLPTSPRPAAKRRSTHVPIQNPDAHSPVETSRQPFRAVV
ncbi:hypothetical protein FN846DRAFT_512299 [Sphaerosporella brunnea]|uniref:Uncharacterized protein n=1 Tax=Sphaerosporella brunnea TaxID=1250544 RepID=A0A5J5F3D9_9PEZI|nr:hypothetical protein FN846DRAFT_512299 [Sphaerosporella brunnea]